MFDHEKRTLGLFHAQTNTFARSWRHEDLCNVTSLQSLNDMF